MACPCEGIVGERPCNTCLSSDRLFTTGLLNVTKQCEAREIMVCKNNAQPASRLDTANQKCQIKWNILGIDFKNVSEKQAVQSQPINPTTTNKDQVDQETAGWLTYQNSEYKFEFKYPQTYKIITDKESWPNAQALLIPKEGAQSYYAEVEIWDNQNDFKNSPSHPHGPAFIVQNGNKFITFDYVEDESVMKKIIETFKLIE
jgi:hypothetical protein